MNKQFGIGFIFAIVIMLLVTYLNQHQTGPMSPQSKANLAAADNPSLLSAIKQYPKAWPPVYPTVLWISTHLGLPVRYFNLLCFYLLLILVWFFFRRYVVGIHPVFPVFLFALTHSSYVNIYQQVSESLFVLLGFLIMIQIAQYRNSATVYYALLLGLFSSTTALTRFFGLFWVVPIAIGALWFPLGNRSPRERILHLAAYCSVLALSVIPWLLLLKIYTGSFSGMKRISTRNLPESIAHWNELTDFSTNVLFLVKTIFIDFFSVSRFASHPVVESNLTLWEYTAAIFVLIIIAIMALAVVHVCIKKSHSNKMFVRKLLISTKALPFNFAVVYIISIVVIWSIAKIDPIYTRFMYPSYVFIVLSFFCLYSWIKNQKALVWHKMPFYSMYFIYVAINLFKIIGKLSR